MRRRFVAAMVAVISVLVLVQSSASAQEPRADVVRVGVLVNDIQQLDLQSHSYNVDMYIWFKWKNPDIDPSRSFEFLNAFELWGHILTYESDEPERLPDGSYYQVLRNQGKFNAKLPLGRYPFDTQHLVVAIEDSQATKSGLVYVADDRPIALSEDLTLPGWKFEEPSLEVVDNQYKTDFGDPSSANPTYSRVVVDIPVERPRGTYALKLLLPIGLVALTAGLALSVHPRYVEGRIGIGITALLTLVALQITTNSNLPEVDYLLLLDKLYILAYVFAVLTIAVIVRNSWVEATLGATRAARDDRRALVVLIVAFLAIAALILVTSLT